MTTFSKWDIIYTSKFPESIQCKNPICKKYITVSDTFCPHCQGANNISNIISKIRPVILWIDQVDWYQSMAFAIPLSATNPYTQDLYNEPILLTHYSFLHTDSQYKKPMRAVIHQSTRIDGNVLDKTKIIGKITDTVVQGKIENKMLKWIFNI